MLVEKTNFAESQGALKTTSYFWSAKDSLEANIRSLQEETNVYNLSDGIFIEGATPIRSQSLFLDDSPKVTATEISNAFPTMTSKDWSRYPEKGQEQLAKMKEEILKHFQQPFDWDTFSRTLDINLPVTISKFYNFEINDRRMDVYSRIIFDVVTEWYRALIYTNNATERNLLYKNGKRALKEFLDALEWPKELDEV